MAYLIDSLPALGTAWWVEVFSPLSVERAEEITKVLHDTITTFEARYSRFRADSLVAMLNATGILKSPDKETASLLQYGRSLYTRTSGHFNLLVGGVLSARGYTLLPHSAKFVELTILPDPTTDLIIADDEIRLLNGQVDLGGFGKGYLVDVLANLLQEYEVKDFLINGGGDIYGTSDNSQPLTIYLEHPTVAGSFIGTTTLQNEGFAASSPYKRRWKQGEVERNHIVGDVPDCATFVKAKKAVDADAFATAGLLFSEEELHKALQTENITVARYFPTTTRLDRYNFDIRPID